MESPSSGGVKPVRRDLAKHIEPTRLPQPTGRCVLLDAKVSGAITACSDVITGTDGDTMWPVETLPKLATLTSRQNLALRVVATAVRFKC